MTELEGGPGRSVEVDDVRLADLIDTEATVERLATGCVWTEGPVYQSRISVVSPSEIIQTLQSAPAGGNVAMAVSQSVIFTGGARPKVVQIEVANVVEH